MKSIHQFVFSASTALLLCAGALAQSASDSSAPYIAKAWNLNYGVDKEGRVTETFSSRYQVLHERALEQFKTYSFSYSSSIQSGEILEAYTLKKDGRRIAAPAGNYQTETNEGRNGAGPMFSDRTRLSVVYPDLEVGDTVGLSYRVSEKEPMFAGHFSKMLTLSPYEVYEDAQITLTLPTELNLISESHFLKGSELPIAAGMRTLQWNYNQPKPRKWNEEQDSGIWRIDEYPSILLSTFPSYESIAKAYGERALPKAEPTARVRELASQVVGGEQHAREKTRLLYEWVSKNITYGGNCIGVGAVVPRDLDVVLDNKMGDCKDHATLLHALLSAVGVRSEQVLINAGEQYELANTPVVSSVNHVMNFLPDFNLYVDATAKEVPFGYLPSGSYGKPVIHIGAAKALANTPNQAHDTRVQRLTMALKLAPNGSASGEMHVQLIGLEAAGARAYMRNLTSDSEQDFVKQALGNYGYKGSGSLTKGDTSGLSDRYGYSVTFNIDNFLDRGASGAFVLSPVMSTSLPVMNFANVQRRPEGNRPQNCYGFHSYETSVVSQRSSEERELIWLAIRG